MNLIEVCGLLRKNLFSSVRCSSLSWWTWLGKIPQLSKFRTLCFDFFQCDASWELPFLLSSVKWPECSVSFVLHLVKIFRKPYWLLVWLLFLLLFSSNEHLFWDYLSMLQVKVEFQSSLLLQFSSVQSLSRVQLFETPWIAACQASLSVTNSRSSLRLTSIKSVMPSSHLILCCPLLLLPPIPPSIRVFSNESTLHMRWAKYWSFSFSISPSKEHPGLISFRMDWLDLLAV